MIRQPSLWQGVLCRPQKFLNQLARTTLGEIIPEALEGADKTFQIQLCLTSNAQVSALNQRYRHRLGSTNILSFHQFDTLQEIHQEMVQHPHHICLGDLVLSDQTVFDEAQRYQRTLRNHVGHLFVHGLLHLLGYDHQTPQEAACMESLEIKILGKNGISDPYQMP